MYFCTNKLKQIIMCEKLKELQEKYEELFNTVHDFMQNIDNYNVDIPTIMYDEWNEVNKLVGRD